MCWLCLVVLNQGFVVGVGFDDLGCLQAGIKGYMVVSVGVGCDLRCL